MYVGNRSWHLPIRRSNTLDERQKSDEHRTEDLRTFLPAEINSEFLFFSIVNDFHDAEGEMKWNEYSREGRSNQKRRREMSLRASISNHLSISD